MLFGLFDDVPADGCFSIRDRSVSTFMDVPVDNKLAALVAGVTRNHALHRGYSILLPPRTVDIHLARSGKRQEPEEAGVINSSLFMPVFLGLRHLLLRLTCEEGKLGGG